MTHPYRTPAPDPGPMPEAPKQELPTKKPSAYLTSLRAFVEERYRGWLVNVTECGLGDAYTVRIAKCVSWCPRCVVLHQEAVGEMPKCRSCGRRNPLVYVTRVASLTRKEALGRVAEALGELTLHLDSPQEKELVPPFLEVKP